MKRQFASAVVLAILMGSAGCAGQKLKDERTVDIQVGDVKTFDYDAPRADQKVTVVVTPAGSSVDVYVVPSAQAQAAQQAMLNNKKPAGALVAKEKVAKEETLETTIPAKTGFAVVIGNAPKDTKVELKVNGR